MAQKPSLIFVPGAWHTPEYWGKVMSAMETQHYKCIPITLPTSQSTSTSVNFSTDVKVVRDAILAQTTQGLDVVVIAHSYGGGVGPSAIKGLTRKQTNDSTTADTKTGHVIGLCLIGTGFVASGMSFMEFLGGKPPPFWDADYENNLMPLILDPIDMFYHDLPEGEAKYWMGKLTKQALTSTTEGYEAAYEGWRDVPVWYVITKADKAHPVEVQRMLAQTARKAGADVTVREIDASHSPMLSKPDETADIVRQAVEAVTG
ncbi:hypothetical protein FSARC_3673 [Fusarium sarcochroum]|uniref:AB hydrolase-1 domain-containing protein n=1 Tax=Fusarium sarcochroum TaxID=1208366 RepID=A0A8H4XCD4_9HYPO|nr:hypothetical protein FSARC_3673 [Fusarium sarcochroum]